MVCLTTTETVLATLRKLSKVCKVERNKEAGTATATDQKGVKVYCALQKGHNAPWLVRYQNGEGVKWG